VCLLQIFIALAGPEQSHALQVLDLLEDACEGFLSHIESRKFATES